MPNSTPNLRTLRDLKPFGSLSEQALRHLSGFTTLQDLTQGAYLWKMGDEAEIVGIVQTGCMEISRLSSSGNEVSLSVFGPHGLIGASAVAGETTYPATAKASGRETTVAKVFFRLALRGSPVAMQAELKHWLQQQVLDHEQILRERLTILSCGNLEEKLFELLLHLNRYYGVNESKLKGTLPFGLSKAQIGRLLGARSETIIRLCSGWRRLGLVDFENNAVQIHNWELLEQQVHPE